MRDHSLASAVGLAVWALLMTACADVHEVRGADETPLPPASPAVEPHAETGTDGDRAISARPTKPTAARPTHVDGDNAKLEADDAALFLLENDAESELAVMRDGERIAELPAFASWPGYDLAGVTTLVSSARFAVVWHMATRDYDPRGIAANADPGVQPQSSTVQRVMLVRRSDWQVLWQRSSEWLSDAGPPKLAADGRVLLVETPFESYGANAIVVGLNGEEEPVEHSTPLSAPDGDGWMAASTPGYGRTIYGFAHASEFVGVRPLSERLQGDGGDEQYYSPHPHLRADGTFEYISDNDGTGELALVREGPSSLTRIALGRSPDGRASFVRGEHGWLVLSVIASTARARPWLRVDRDGAVHAVDAELQDKEVPSCCAVAHDWIGFRDVGSPEIAAGWLNADTGAVKLAPVLPAGMQPFGLDLCMSSPLLREDGRAWIALRDDVIGGVFFEDDDGGLMRVGLPIHDALTVDITRVGQTLKLDVIHPLYRYCRAPSWTSPEPAEPFLRGGQIQLLRAGRSLVVDGGPGGSPVELDPSGRHAAVNGDKGTVLHDLELGTAHALPESSRFVGWLVP